MKYIKTFEIFETFEKNIYDREIDYKYLDSKIEKELSIYLNDDIEKEVKKALNVDFEKIRDNSYDYYELKPWATIEIQKKAKQYLNENHIEYTTPELLNSLNKMIEEVSKDYGLDDIFDKIIIEYFEKNPKKWIDIQSVWDFTDNVRKKLNYILNIEKFNI